MERFRSINWHLPLENIVDDVFIRNERITKDSSMFKILAGTFQDPFDDIDKDYADVDLESIKCFHENANAEGQVAEQEAKQKMEENDNCERRASKSTNKQQSYALKKAIRSYVPGKKNFYFPRLSYLNKADHAMCLRVLLRFNENKPMTVEDKAEMESFINNQALQKIISTEQNEFLQFVEKNWNNMTTWCIRCEKYLDAKWQTKVQRVQELPRYYIESKINIPFSLDKEVAMEFACCLQQGSFSEVVLPKFDGPCYLRAYSSMLLKKYPPNFAPNEHFRLPVSEDARCESFAKETKADLVISSSGLKCLLKNIGSNYLNSWILPVVIRSHHGKNVVYIEKKLSPIAATTSQKNTWVYKYILRHLFIRSKNKSLNKVTNEKSTKKEKADVAKLCSDFDDECDEAFNEYLKDYTNDLCSEKTDDAIDDAESFSVKGKSNIMYKLFTINPIESQNQYELDKDSIKKYRVLIRTKTDGVEMLPNEELLGTQCPLILAPKMEHQLAFGAEAITIEEGLQQWVSLQFRPEASLARIRIAMDSTEVIQIERHTTATLSNEIKRLHDVKVTDSLKILYNVIERLSSLTPGRYIIRHTASNGPFACIYKEIKEKTNHAFDLHAVYESKKFETIPVTQWPSIDPMLVTPAHKSLNKMPAMFHPCNIKVSKPSDSTQKSQRLRESFNKCYISDGQGGPVKRSFRERNQQRKK